MTFPGPDAPMLLGTDGIGSASILPQVPAIPNVQDAPSRDVPIWNPVPDDPLVMSVPRETAPPEEELNVPIVEPVDAGRVDNLEEPPVLRDTHLGNAKSLRVHIEEGSSRFEEKPLRAVPTPGSSSIMARRVS